MSYHNCDNSFYRNSSCQGNKILLNVLNNDWFWKPGLYNDGGLRRGYGFVNCSQVRTLFYFFKIIHGNPIDIL